MGFSTQNINVGVDFLAKIIKIDITKVIFRLKNIDLDAKFGKNSNTGRLYSQW